MADVIIFTKGTFEMLLLNKSFPDISCLTGSDFPNSISGKFAMPIKQFHPSMWFNMSKLPSRWFQMT